MTKKKIKFENCASKCIAKRSFDTEVEALDEMAFLRVSKEYKKLKRAYLCDLCKQWHLTKREEL